MAGSVVRSTCRSQERLRAIQRWIDGRTRGHFTVLRLRDKLEALGLNLWWTWNPEVIELFRELDPGRCRDTDHNPIALSARLPDDLRTRRIEDTSLESRINCHCDRLQGLPRRRRQVVRRTGGDAARCTRCILFGTSVSTNRCPCTQADWVFSPETTSRAPPDLGVPVVGVGLFCARGYFRQRAARIGITNEEYGTNDIATDRNGSSHAGGGG